MKPDPNYPRWMFHRTRPMVMVQNEKEEKALGPEWSRIPVTAAALPPEEKPQPPPEPEPGEDEPETEEEEEEPFREPTYAPLRKPPVIPPLKPPKHPVPKTAAAPGHAKAKRKR